MKKLRKDLEHYIPELGEVGINQYSEGVTCNTHNEGRGNSREYRIALLKRDAPDIAERVIKHSVPL